MWHPGSVRLGRIGIGLLVLFVCRFDRPAAASPLGELISGQVSEASYRDYLENRLYARLGHNRGFGPEHDLARANIVTDLTDAGLAVELNPFVYNTVTYYNVIGTMTGTQFPSSYYIVCAHFDSVNNPGADDNGTGTAAVLEAARVLAAYESAYTIRFILWDREEQGMRGSTAYANAHASDDIRGVVNLDMIGHDSGEYAMEIYGRSASQGLMVDLLAAYDLYGGNLRGFLRVGNYGFSDHYPFEQRGFAACSTIEWCYSCNAYYHTLNDAVDIYPGYINYPMVTDVVRGAVGYLVDHAGVTLPQTPGDFDGDGDVDLSDFIIFQQCFGGSNNPPAPTCPPGIDADLDRDGDVDLADFLIFQQNFTGSL